MRAYVRLYCEQSIVSSRTRSLLRAFTSVGISWWMIAVAATAAVVVAPCACVGIALQLKML